MVSRFVSAIRRVARIGVLAGVVGLSSLAGPAEALTLKMLILPEPWSGDTDPTDGPIEAEMLEAFRKGLSYSAVGSFLEEAGVERLDVLDARMAASLARRPEEAFRTVRDADALLDLLRSAPDAGIDAVLVYDLDAEFGQASPHTPLVMLDASLEYRLLDVANGYLLGVGTVGLDERPVVTGCAFKGDPDCVRRFVADHTGPLATETAVRVAATIAGLLRQP